MEWKTDSEICKVGSTALRRWRQMRRETKDKRRKTEDSRQQIGECRQQAAGYSLQATENDRREPEDWSRCTYADCRPFQTSAKKGGKGETGEKGKSPAGFLGSSWVGIWDWKKLRSVSPARAELPFFICLWNLVCLKVKIIN